MSDLSFHVHHFVPTAQGEELELRTALLKARDYASALKSRVASDTAYDLACAAHEWAGLYVYAEVPLPRLKIAVSLCRNLVQAAFSADHLEGEAR